MDYLLTPVPVIIPMYGKDEQVLKCLAHLDQQTWDCKLYLEDNNQTNRGFTRAVNDGLRKLRRFQPYAVILNQDAYLSPNAIEEMVKFMETHPRCAIGGIKQVYDMNPDMIYHGGGRDILPAGTHYGGRVSSGDCGVSRPVGWVNGACMIVRMAATVDIGFMDENMFLCGSDADWCVTAAMKSWEVWYIAEAVCRHVVGVSAAPEPINLMFCQITEDMGYLTRKLAAQFPEPSHACE